MIVAVRAEFRRLARRPGAWGLAVLVVAITVFAVVANLHRLNFAESRVRIFQQAPAASLGGPPRVVILQAQRDAAVLEADLQPKDRVRLAIGVLGTAPGLVLMLFLGALVVGSEDTWGTWKILLGTGVGRRQLLGGKLVTLWASAGLVLVLGTVVTLLAFGLLGPAHDLKAVGPASIPPMQLFGAWLGLGLFGTLAAVVSVLMRSALGGLGIAAVVCAAMIMAELAAAGFGTNGALVRAAAPGSLAGVSFVSAIQRLSVAHLPVGPFGSGPVTGLWLPDSIGTGGGTLSSLVVMVAWILSLAAAGIIAFQRRDIR